MIYMKVTLNIYQVFKGEYFSIKIKNKIVLKKEINTMGKAARVSNNKGKKSRKLFLQNNIQHFCFHIKLVNDLFNGDMDPVYCGNCIQCLLNFQCYKAKQEKLRLAPKKKEMERRKVYIEPRNLLQEFNDCESSHCQPRNFLPHRNIKKEFN